MASLHSTAEPVVRVGWGKRETCEKKLQAKQAKLRQKQKAGEGDGGGIGSKRYLTLPRQGRGYR